MKNQKKWLAMCLLMVACSAEPVEELNSESAPEVMALNVSPPPMAEIVKFSPPVVKDDAVEEEPGNENSESSLTEQKIVKTAYLTIQVDTAEAAKSYVDSLVKKFNGRYENDEFRNNWSRKTYELQIRIPTPDFANFLSALEQGEGILENKQVTEEDVTANYVDLESRLKTKKQFIGRYYELLKKATTVKSMLEIEENLRGLQEEIEAHESRLKQLGSQVSYSTVYLNLYRLKEEITKPVELPGFLTSMQKAAVSGYYTILNALYAITRSWPLVVISLLALLVIKRYLKRRKVAQVAKQGA